MIKHSEEFKREAVRIALTSGLPRVQRDNQGENLPGWLGVGRSPEPVHPGRSILRGQGAAYAAAS